MSRVMHRETLAEWRDEHEVLVQRWRQAQQGEPPCHFTLLAEVDSTNTWLLRHATEPSDPQPRLCLAFQQHAGRGRHGRTWLSAPGWSLTFSLGRWWHHELRMLPTLTLALGLGLARGLSHCGYRDFFLKWPNDLWTVTGAKLAGILLETRPTGAGRTWVVAGIGLNRGGVGELNLERPAADLSMLPGPVELTSAALLGALLPFLLAAWDQFERAGSAAVIADFAAWDGLSGRQVTVRETGLCGIAVGLDPESGALIVQQRDGQRIPVGSGEVLLCAPNQTTAAPPRD